MKILILSSRLPIPPKDGGAIATLGMACGLADAGNEITLLCLNTNKHFVNPSEIPSRYTLKMRIIPIFHDTSIRAFSALNNLIFSSEPYNAIRFYSTAFENELIRLIKNEKFDVVQMEGPYLAYYIPAIRKYSNSQISLRAHNVEHEIWARKSSNEKNPLRKWYLNSLAKRIKSLEFRTLQKIDILIPISERDELQLLKLNSKPSSIAIPAGLDAENYPKPENPAYPSLFFIGSLDWMPNQEGLVWFIDNVWPLLQADSIIPLHIGGRAAPDWLIKKFKSANIIYHGEIDNAYEFMNNYAMMISPVLSGSGIRIKILEALMMGKLVISTNIGSEGIAYTHSENILLSDNAIQFAEFIKEYLTDKAKYDAIATKGRAFVLESFNNLALCKKLNEFYRNNLK